MLKKALLKALTNLTPEEKDEVRKSLGEGQPASEENVDEHEGKGAEKNEKTAEDTKEKAADGSAGEEDFEDETDAGEEDGESKVNPGNETRAGERRARGRPCDSGHAYGTFGSSERKAERCH